MIVIARLIKRVTDDGLMEVLDTVVIGHEYEIELDSLRVVKGYNYAQDQSWEREMVRDVKGGWLPTELLEWDRG